MATTLNTRQFMVSDIVSVTGTIKGTAADKIAAGTLLVLDTADGKWKVWDNEDVSTFGLAFSDVVIPAGGNLANENIIIKGKVRADLLTLPESTTLATVPNKKQVIEPIQYQVTALAAGGDITATAFYMPLKITEVEGLGILTQGTPAGIDDSNTAVITIKNGSNTVVTKTYNAATQPPTSGYESLGTLANNDLTASKFLTYEITQGTTANLPPFMIVGTAIRNTTYKTNLYYALAEQGIFAETYLNNCY